MHLLLLSLLARERSAPPAAMLVTISEVDSGEVVLTLVRSAADDPAFAFIWHEQAYSVQSQRGSICLYHNGKSDDVHVDGVPDGSFPTYTILCREYDQPEGGLTVPGTEGALIWGFESISRKAN
jgi:hypothetical protein